MSQAFKDKVVIVTGANDGIGRATTELFLEQGAKVAAFDVRPSKAQSNDSRLDIVCDVSSEESVNAAVKQVVEKWQSIDVLCNVAGIMDQLERVTETTTQQFQRILGVNVNGIFFTMRAVIPHFLAKDVSAGRRGAIVNISSVAGRIGGAAGFAYTTSKHAVLGMSRNTAVMYAKEGIACNVVIPGGVKTNIMANSGSQEFSTAGHEALKGGFARQLGIAEPVDIAKAVVFLASATSVNGAELTVDYGWSIA